ncbi:Holliday junction resolvase RuvX [Tatumella ptyseos]|uniref:Holliday junction resolvase RuvX n=1 Tax=Tatumella ptyseos TaxID=82987 RepID=UPI0026ECEB8F|nr:Holliday junction resolvase RuvX [Tatumella ptyseos]WKX27125.1 Holliday junction resolvase RuvX [Tatumella ptyseos]
MSNQTIIAFDFGTRSIGIAVGQTLTATASPLAAVKAQDGVPDWTLIEKVISEWQPDYLVVGLPLNMDGSEQELTQRAKKFANRLHGRLGKKVELQDERLSTTEARSRLFEKGGYKSLSKGRVDSQSAVIILESWFEALYQ